MRHRIVHKSDFLTIEYNAVDDFLHVIWTIGQSSDTIREGYEHVLSHIRSEFCRKVLDDQRHIQGIWVDIADWVVSDWYPRAQQAGLASHVVIYPEDFFGKRSTEEALRRIPGGGIVGFEDALAAERYLVSL